jgi:pyrroloquinoline quinone biosynthesis protein B
MRRGVLKGRTHTQAQVAISPSGSTWFLLNASPDLRQQISVTPELAPKEGGRNTPIAAIILTSADVDSVLGLLHLREFQPLRIYATPSVRRALTEENTLFRTLERSTPSVQWESLPVNEAVRICSVGGQNAEEALSCTAIPLGGELPDYVSDGLRRKLNQAEAVVGLQLAHQGKQLLYAPGLSGRGEEWKRAATESDLALLDGTFWTDDELVKVLGGGKTARQMGHLPLSGTNGLLEQMQSLRKPRRVLIHLNNTNPVLDEESAAHRAVRDAGWEVAYDGMEITL